MSKKLCHNKPMKLLGAVIQVMPKRPEPYDERKSLVNVHSTQSNPQI
jgi:hypothetical protein